MGSAFFISSGCSLTPGLRVGYQTEKGEVRYYTGFPATGLLLKDADPGSFSVISNDFGKDKSHVYNRDEVIEGADPETFEYLGGSFSKDKLYGYCAQKKVSDDGAHFAIVPNPETKPGVVNLDDWLYARDSKNVFSGNEKLEGVDVATFKISPMFGSDHLTSDRNHVYDHNQPIEGADGASFKKLTVYHFEDKNHVWVSVMGSTVIWKIMDEADPLTFQGLGKYYAKDKNHVFYENRIVKGADIGSFEELEEFATGKDKYGNYKSGVLVPVNKKDSL